MRNRAFVTTQNHFRAATRHYRTLAFAFALTCALAEVIPAQSQTATPRSDTIVRQVGPPLHREVGTAVLELTVGAGRSGVEYEFTRIGAVTILRDSSVVLVDHSGAGVNQVVNVRQFDRNGIFLRNFGRQGQGPGEYRNPGAIIQHPDGRVLMSDANAIHVYSSDGRPLTDWTVVRSGSNTGSMLHVDPSGIISAYASVRREGVAFTATSTTSQLFRVIRIRLRFDGSVLDTTASPQDEFPRPNRMERVNVPFVPSYHTTFSPLGYQITAFSGKYAVDLRLQATPERAWQTGDPIVSIRRTTQPVPVIDAERADWRASTESFMRSTAAGGNLQWQWSGPEIPRVKPPISGIMISDEGRIWVKLHQTAVLDTKVALRPSAPVVGDNATPFPNAGERWKEPIVFDVFETSAQYVGQVRLPPELTVRAIRGDVIWGTTTDADGVVTLRKYRLRW